MITINVPKIFQPIDRIVYPNENNMTTEEVVYNEFSKRNIASSLIYVPIFWTTYHSRSNFGHDDIAIKKVKKFVQSISRPWFTISQYDDGILIDKSEIKTRFVSLSAGGKGDIPIPLTRYAWPDEGRGDQKYLASFVGNLKTEQQTNIRAAMIEKLSDKPEFFFYDTSKTYGPFKDIMLRSRFALCPRGYGRTSFRLYEAMQMGTIPIYISDVHWLPFQKYVNWDDICIRIFPNQLSDLYNTLTSISNERIVAMSEACKRAWIEYFSYTAMTKMIIKMLENGDIK